MDQVFRLIGLWAAGVIALFVFLVVLDRLLRRRAKAEETDTRNKGDMLGPG